MFLSEMEGPESQLYVPGGPEKGTASCPLGKMLDRNPPQKKTAGPGGPAAPSFVHKTRRICGQSLDKPRRLWEDRTQSWKIFLPRQNKRNKTGGTV